MDNYKLCLYVIQKEWRTCNTNHISVLKPTSRTISNIVFREYERSEKHSVTLVLTFLNKHWLPYKNFNLTGWDNTLCLQCNSFADTAFKGRMSDFGCLCAVTRARVVGKTQRWRDEVNAPNYQNYQLLQKPINSDIFSPCPTFLKQ